jgi:very-short-patch-repair endonuclease
MIKLLRDAGLAGWVRGHWLAGFEPDFAFPGRRIAIEVDGWAWHWDVERFRTDRQRQNTLELAGWTVLRFTWHDLTHQPAQVAAQIQAALGRTEHERGMRFEVVRASSPT